MDWLQVVVLALVQGLTEFLPISSSAHLILVPALTEWADQGLAFDVAVHFGSLLAVLGYFRHELRVMAVEWLRSLRGGALNGEARLAWAVLLATVPVGLAGLVVNRALEGYLREAVVIALATLGFGLVLWWADARARQTRDEHSLGWRDVLVVGGAQALALVPGTSRSGITITAGLAMGLSREAAARFSFLMAIPVILLAGALEASELWLGAEPIPWGSLLAGFSIAAVSAYACIHVFLTLVKRVGMLPFVIYRMILGLVLLVMFWPL